ncbi:hypothetical protein [Propioniferax innocua]|uniref:Lipoprotein n=1 Tax=Propioniferax innocua TaxID=1753 RepID=A0A542ZC86_9ACTN|nr:hypothetical protein [Propioniferax innocua]TQL57965.1 hypothetical protein FB460_1814 [Propioniferax innocua]
MHHTRTSLLMFGVLALVVVTACTPSAQITTEPTDDPEARAAQTQAASLLEIAIEGGCDAAIDAYLPTYAEPKAQPVYRTAHEHHCEADAAQQALSHHAWHCIADLIEMERIRVQCHSVDPDDRSVRTGHVVPFAHRKPTHFRGGNTMIRWSGVR